VSFTRKLRHPYIWKRIFYERLTEPVHLNAISLAVAMFGSFRDKVDFDLVVRQHHAYGLLAAADRAAKLGIDCLTAIEFGVAAGAGLMNMERIADQVTEITGVRFSIVGFDTGQGMPPARDFRDHPDLYQAGDFRMDTLKLRRHLRPDTRLVIGELAQTIGPFLDELSPDEPIGFVSLDVDYYHSAAAALEALTGDPRKYLPIAMMYIDDIELDAHNSFCGELLAIREFNASESLRKIEHHCFLQNQRVFQRANWIKHMFQLHVLDHPVRSRIETAAEPRVLENPMLAAS